MYANGSIPDTALAAIPGGRLRKDAAAAWNAMCAQARRRGLPAPMPAGPVSSYRPLAAQQHFWALYESGRGNPAARPGTSNHGWGVAVDVTPAGWRTLTALGPRYGFTHAEGARVGEAWHFSNPAGAAATFPHFQPAGPLRHRSRGPRVRELQRRLRALGFASVPVKGRGYGFLGRSTLNAVQRFQRAHHLTADGIVGATTTAALKRAAS